MPGWLSPHDAWPAHPDKEAQKALRDAKDAGWWFKPSQGHVFGTLTCTEPEGMVRQHSDQVCTAKVYSTAGRSGATANHIRDQIRTCRHGASEGPATAPLGREAEVWRLREAQRHLDAAERLLDACDALIARHGHQARAEELLQAAAEQRDNAIQALAFKRAAVEEDAASHAARRAQGLAEETGWGRPWPPDDPASQLLDPAEASLEEAERVLDPAAGLDDDPCDNEGVAGEADSAWRRLKLLCRRVHDCRKRLEA